MASYGTLRVYYLFNFHYNVLNIILVIIFYLISNKCTLDFKIQ